MEVVEKVDYGKIISIFLENASYLANIIICVLTILTVYVAYNSFQDSKQRRSKEKAVDLARMYQNEILSELSFITNVLDVSKMGKELKDTFPASKMEQFDQKELEEILGGQAEVIELEKKLDEISPRSILIVKIMSTTDADLLCHLVDCLGSSELDKNTKLAIKNEWLISRSNLLNSLEWFSMNFITGTASEKDVYQSLHQTFISAVGQLYFFISNNNDCSSRKFFTNTIELYKLWKERSDNQVEQEKENYKSFREGQNCIPKKAAKLKD